VAFCSIVSTIWDVICSKVLGSGTGGRAIGLLDVGSTWETEIHKGGGEDAKEDSYSKCSQSWVGLTSVGSRETFCVRLPGESTRTPQLGGYSGSRLPLLGQARTWTS